MLYFYFIIAFMYMSVFINVIIIAASRCGVMVWSMNLFVYALYRNNLNN